MSASLVGSEMCIRDRLPGPSGLCPLRGCQPTLSSPTPPARTQQVEQPSPCLLYTSDAADDM
eukprot:2952579-Alexandrium_andersonii.AAC.1